MGGGQAESQTVGLEDCKAGGYRTKGAGAGKDPAGAVSGVGGSSPASRSRQLLVPGVQDRLRVRTGTPKARATQCLLLEVVAVPGPGRACSGPGNARGKLLA